MSEPAEIPLTGGGRTSVSRIGDTVHRETGPWAPAVHALLRHFEAEGFDGAPRVVGTGFDASGRETLSYIEGASLHPHAWPEDAMAAIGALLRRAHDAAAGFTPPPGAVWRGWFGRTLGDPARIFGHCDAGQWNIIARDGLPVALIDWEQAGPVDPMIDLAQAAWLNAHLFDDDIAERLALPSPQARAKNLRLLLEGYGLAAPARQALIPTMIAFAVHDTAKEAIEGAETPVDGFGAMAWRARSAAWMLRHRVLLEAAVR